MGEKPGAVLGTAFDHIGPKRVVIGIRHSREAAQFRIGPVIAGQRGKGDAGLVQVGGILRQPIGPVAGPAENARDDHARFHRAIGHMQIDRHRVAQMHQAGQPQAGRIGHFGARGAERGKFGIGGRDEHQIGGRLARIDRFGPVVDGTGCGGKKVHGCDPGLVLGGGRRPGGPPMTRCHIPSGFSMKTLVGVAS